MTFGSSKNYRHTSFHQFDAEAVVLKAYRIWFRAVRDFDEFAMGNLLQHFQNELGAENGQLAFDSFVNYLSNFSRCVHCPIRYFAMNSPHICREECLFISLISGIQNGDDDVAHRCASSFCNIENRCEVLNQAAEFAFLMKSFGKQFVPVPIEFIEQVVNMTGVPESTSRTIH